MSTISRTLRYLKRIGFKQYAYQMNVCVSPGTLPGITATFEMLMLVEFLANWWHSALVGHRLYNGYAHRLIIY